MDACIDLMEKLFRDEAAGLAESRPRQHLSPPSGGFLRVMIGAAYGEDAFGLKTYAAVRGGPRYLVLLYRASTAELLAIVEARYLGQVRTGAAAGVATRYLARPDATRLAIIGSGREARAQLEAMLEVRSIESVRCYSRSAERREQFAREMTSKFGVSVEAVQTGTECVAGADVVCTITSANTPVLEGAWLEPGMHLNAIGATSLYRREIDAEAVRRADRIVVENIEQAKHECGELIYAAERGSLRWPTVLELRQLVGGEGIAGRRQPDEITLFDGLGVAAMDVAGAAHVYRQAQATGMGVELPIPARV